MPATAIASSRGRPSMAEGARVMAFITSFIHLEERMSSDRLTSPAWRRTAATSSSRSFAAPSSAPSANQEPESGGEWRITTPGPCIPDAPSDRKSGVEGKGGAGCEDLGGRRSIKKKKKK